METRNCPNDKCDAKEIPITDEKCPKCSCIVTEVDKENELTERLTKKLLEKQEQERKSREQRTTIERRNTTRWRPFRR